MGMILELAACGVDRTREQVKSVAMKSALAGHEMLAINIHLLKRETRIASRELRDRGR